MIEAAFLIVFIVVLIASITDLRSREVPDWLSYSFISIALVSALAMSIIKSDYQFVLNAMIGVISFYIIGSVLYHLKFFAGGDVKLLTGLGGILGANFSFLIVVFFIGGVYGLLFSVVLAAINWKKFSKRIKQTKFPYWPFIICSLMALVYAIFSNIFFFYFIAVLAILSPLLYVFVKVVEEISLIKKVHPSKLTEGDWLVKDVRIGRKLIKARFDGLSKREIALLIKAKKSVEVKYGLPFVPVFLIALLYDKFFGSLFVLITGLIN